MTDARLRPDLAVLVGRVEGVDRDALARALEATGLTVRAARDCDDAAAALRFLPVRLLVVGLDGRGDVWTLIRRATAGPHPIPVACASGRPTLSRIAGALRRGARTFVVPPIDAELVREKLAPLLEVVEEAAASDPGARGEDAELAEPSPDADAADEGGAADAGPLAADERSISQHPGI